MTSTSTRRSPARSRRAAVCWALAVIAPGSLLVTAGAAHATPPSYTLSFFAGTGATGAPTPGPATASAIDNPRGVASDAAGNTYLVARHNHRVMKVDSSGVLSVFAGTGVAGTSTPGPATASALSYPGGVAVDAAGNVFIADSGNSQVVKVTPGGTLSVIAGTGSRGASTAGPATASALDSPYAVAADAAGNVYIGDNTNVIDEVTPSGVLSIVAGSGSRGTPTTGPATASDLGFAGGLAVDGAGNVYIADSDNSQVEKVTPGGTLSIVAGNGSPAAPTPGPATASALAYPGGLAVDAAGNVYVSDQGNALVEKIDTTGTLSVIAGTGTFAAPTPGPATTSAFSSIEGVAVTADGDVLVADGANNRVVLLAAPATVTAPTVTSAAPAAAAVGIAYSHTFTATGAPAPTWSVTSGTLPAGLSLNTATGVLSGTPTTAGTVSVTVTATNSAGSAPQVITFSTVPSYTLSVFAGTGTAGVPTSGPAAASALNFPYGAAVDVAGNVYITDVNNNRVEKIDTSGTLSVIAGTGVAGAPTAGPATASALNGPLGIAVDTAGNLYIADSSNNQVEKIDTTGTLSIIAGTGSPVAPTPGPATASALNGPAGMAVDAAGNLYIADRGNHVIEKIDTTGTLSIVAGTGTAGAPTSGLATASDLIAPNGVAVDRTGNIFIAAQSNRKILKVDTTGDLSVIAGTGGRGSPTPGPATDSELDAPSGVAVDTAGNVYITDYNNLVVEKVDTAGDLSIIAGTGSPGAPTPGPATASALTSPNGIAVNTAGNVYIADAYNHRVDLLTAPAPAPVPVPAPTPVATTPGAPIVARATAAETAATVTFSPPTATGSTPITSYRVTTTGGGLTTPIITTGTGSPITIEGLQPGRTYTFTVAAVNSAGTGPASAPITATWAAPAVPVASGVTRLAGTDRTETATNVSKALFPTDGRATAAVIATSRTYADAIGGSRLASAVNGPLLLSGTAALESGVAAEIRRTVTPGGTVYILGDTFALSQSVRDGLAELNSTYTITRLGGVDRFETAVAIADAVTTYTAKPDAPIYLASGTNYPDGLAVTALASKTGGVVVLTNGSTLPAATAAYLTAHDPTGARTTTVGGPAATAYPKAGASLVGADRYETSALIAAKFPTATTTTVGLASGANWPDALVGAAAMGIIGGPVLLTEPTNLTPATKTVIQANTHLTAAWVFGGPSSLSTATEAQVKALLPPTP